MESTKQLLSEVDSIDKKIEENEQVLKAVNFLFTLYGENFYKFQNNIDLFQPLVDEYDFPLDIDVAAVRNARHSIICNLFNF